MIKTVEFKVLIYFFGKALTALISLAIIPLFIKWFGEENYGNYIIIYVTFLIFVSGSIGWVNQSIIKYHGEYIDRKVFYGKAHSISFVMALISVVPLLIVVSLNIQEETILLIFLIAIGYISACIYTSKLIETQAELKSLRFSIAEIIRLLGFVLCVVGLKTLSLFNVLETLFLSLFISYMSSYIYLVKSIKIKFISVDFSMVKKFLSFGLPLSIWMVFSPSANGIEKYIVKSYLGVIVLAQYAAVYDVIFKIFTQLVNPINSVYQPLLMNIHSSGDKVLFKKTLKRGLITLMLICLPFLGLLFYFQDFILRKYLGFTDENNIILLKEIVIPLAVSAIIWQLAIILQKKLEALEKTKILTLYIVIVVLLSSLCSIWLLPKYDFSILSYINLLASIVYLLLIYITNIFYSEKG